MQANFVLRLLAEGCGFLNDRSDLRVSVDGGFRRGFMYVDNILYPVTALGPGRRIVIWTAGCHRHCDGCANPELWEARHYQKISPERLADMVGSLMDQKKGQVDGLTITGGEPFEQAGDLCIFLDLLREKMRQAARTNAEAGIQTNAEAGIQTSAEAGIQTSAEAGIQISAETKLQTKAEVEVGIGQEEVSLTFPYGIQVFSGFLLEDLRGQAECAALLDRIDVLIDGEYIKEQNDGKTVLRGSLNQRIHYLNPAMEEIYAPYLKEGRKIENFVYDYRTLSVGIHNP